MEEKQINNETQNRNIGISVQPKLPLGNTKQEYDI